LGLIQSPDSVALQYKVPLWSNEHFQYMEESLKRLGQVGNKTAFIPLMAKCNFGNEESMVRFLKQEDGSYKCDFSITDRYLDLWEKHVGKPDIVCFYVWDYFAGGGYFGKDSGKARGVEVSVWNPVEQKVEPLETPIYGTPESEAFWQPVFTELHEKMKKRGLRDDNIMIGVAGDSRPNKAVTDLFLKIAPYAQWVLHSHALAGQINGAKVGYYCHVWGVKFASDPDEVDKYTKKSRYQGWNQTFRKAVFPRAGSGTINPPLHADAPLGTYRLIMEGHLAADYRGFGRVGADFWPVGGGTGQVNTGREIIGRYPGTSWNQLNLNCSTTAVLAPGPKGAIATVRFEMLREGIQESEARIFIEKALINPEHRKKLGDEKAKQIQDLLDLRTRLFRTACQTSWNWYAGTGWIERAKLLFAAAAEVQTALKAP
jgi:hypothetical protein